jgi:hypothetical protein
VYPLPIPEVTLDKGIYKMSDGYPPALFHLEQVDLLRFCMLSHAYTCVRTDPLWCGETDPWAIAQIHDFFKAQASAYFAVLASSMEGHVCGGDPAYAQQWQQTALQVWIDLQQRKLHGGNKSTS